MDEVLKDFGVTRDLLIADVLRAAAEVDSIGDGFARRNYIRAVFAAMEGITYSMKRVVLRIANEKEGKLNADELDSLNDTKLDGEGKSNKAFLPFEKNIKLVFKMFAKIHGFAYPADFQGTGWPALLKSAEIRNRLMHPKSSAALEVSDLDLNKIREAADWFFPTLNQLMTQATTTLPPIGPTRK